jgi:hypothetical protein
MLCVADDKGKFDEIIEDTGTDARCWHENGLCRGSAEVRIMICDVALSLHATYTTYCSFRSRFISGFLVC